MAVTPLGWLQCSRLYYGYLVVVQFAKRVFHAAAVMHVLCLASRFLWHTCAHVLQAPCMYTVLQAGCWWQTCIHYYNPRIYALQADTSGTRMLTNHSPHACTLHCMQIFCALEQVMGKLVSYDDHWLHLIAHTLCCRQVMCGKDVYLQLQAPGKSIVLEAGFHGTGILTNHTCQSHSPHTCTLHCRQIFRVASGPERVKEELTYTVITSCTSLQRPPASPLPANVCCILHVHCSAGRLLVASLYCLCNPHACMLCRHECRNALGTHTLMCHVFYACTLPLQADLWWHGGPRQGQGGAHVIQRSPAAPLCRGQWQALCQSPVTRGCSAGVWQVPGAQGVVAGAAAKGQQAPHLQV